jgi:hypothetical protein
MDRAPIETNRREDAGQQSYVDCRATDRTYRLDTPSAREFIGQYVTLP